MQGEGRRGRVGLTLELRHAFATRAGADRLAGGAARSIKSTSETAPCAALPDDANNQMPRTPFEISFPVGWNVSSSRRHGATHRPHVTAQSSIDACWPVLRSKTNPTSLSSNRNKGSTNKGFSSSPASTDSPELASKKRLCLSEVSRVD
jgi:hypothetical protein